jgi:GNAT superfamily N-acetyltransferase
MSAEGRRAAPVRADGKGDEPMGFVVRMATRREAPEVIRFNERVLSSDASGDPFTVSMRSEAGYAADSLYGRNDFITFILIENATDRIIGRCLLNTNPTPDDYGIAAYGTKAACILDRYRSAVFGGDLIDPSWRGMSLHRLLIEARIAFLFNRGFEYMFVPILAGNHISLNSYRRFGVEFLGFKTMRYQVPVEVELYGRALQDARRDLRQTAPADRDGIVKGGDHERI